MNKALLEYEMKRKGVTLEELCKRIGISRTAFYRKCNHKSEFTLAEIKGIITILDLESPVDIFFAE